MTADDAFLQPVLENPDDDAPRLAYADWLDKQGRTEAAEFIRVQCALAAGRVPVGAEKEQMERRERAFLWRKQGQEWAAPLREWTASLGFRRGFAENVIVADNKAESVVTCAREVLRRTPVRYLELKGICDEEADISPLGPDLTRLQGLMLTNIFNLVEGGLQRLLTSPHLAGVKSLVLECNHNGIGLSPEMFAAMFASPYWARLSELVFNSGDFVGLADAAVLALARSPSMAALTRLDLAKAVMAPATAKALAESPYLTHLVELNLAECEIGEGGAATRPQDWRPLIESPNLSRLRWLGLGEDHINETILAMWQERFPPGVLEILSVPAVPWPWHRWNRYFPEISQPEFVVADCVSPTPRRLPRR